MKHRGAKERGHLPPWLMVVIGLGVVFSIYVLYYFVEKRWLSGSDMSTLHTLHLLRGVFSSVILAGVTAWYLINRRVPVFPTGVSTEVEASIGQTDREMRLRQHAYWFINLRWLAISVALVLIFVSSQVTGILPRETFVPLMALVAVLALSNVVYTIWSRHTRRPYFCIVVQVLSDLVILTGLLHFSGGLENPLFIIYSFHVIISGILLTKRTAYALALAACGLLGFLALGEFFQIFGHYAILLFPHENGVTAHAVHNPYYVTGRFFPFAGVLLCVAYFTTLVMDHLRKNEERLVQMTRVASAERQKLDTAVNAAGAGMLLLDRDLHILWFNKRYQEWFDRGNQLLGRCCNLSNSQEGAPSNCENCISARAVEEGTALEMEREITSPKQGKRFYHITASPIRNEDGEITQVVELIQDITDRKAMEFEMLHTGKMAVLGRMAAGIAHEIGNPLSSMSTRIRLMESRREGKFLQESLRVLQEQVGRIGRIIHGISQFARPQEEDWAPCRINDILKEAVEVIKLDRRAKGIAIEMSLTEGNPVTSGTKDKFIQVFINLGLNAVEAMGGAGTLKISSELSNGSILVSFKDTGPGLTDEARANLFNPFYTTKEQGLGLGLFICYSIINSYGGNIEMESEGGKGTTFTIRLPVRHHQPNTDTVGVRG